jgi:hypothetical protein
MKKAFLTLAAIMLVMVSCNKNDIDDELSMESAFKSENALTKGYDQWGYNYTANMFNGFYDNYSRPAVPVTEGTRLMMKWNDAWLNEDKVRHEGFDSYRGSGAWLTNHEMGDDYTYFVKIVAAPLDATVVNGYWVSVDGVEIGPVIWGSFAIIQEQATGNYDLEIFRSKFKTGLGNW